MSQTTRALVLIFALLSAIPARAEPAAQNADLGQALAAKMPPTRVEPFEGVGHLLVLRFFDEAE